MCPASSPGGPTSPSPAALILETVATTFGVESFTFSEAALRDGVLVDTRGADSTARRRHRSTACTTCATCRAAASASSPSAATTTRPTRPTSPAWPLELFDALQPLHDLDGTAREYLEAGALLANVGLVVAHSKHHLHAYYVIRNSELAGLTDLEIEIIAQIARYHRKSEPKASHAEFAALDADDQALVRTLAGILRVAIGLDRSHRGLVESVRAEIQARRIVVFATPRPGADVEPRALRRQRAQGPARARHRPPRRAAAGLIRGGSAGHGRRRARQRSTSARRRGRAS